MPEPSRSPLREKILDRAKEHLSAEGRRSIEVEEWECTIYWKPMSLRDRGWIARVADRDGVAEAQAQLICRKAEDADGLHMFDADDKRVFLDKANVNVVQRIANAMSNDEPSEANVGAAAKN